MSDFNPDKENQMYWRGVMDGIASIHIDLQHVVDQAKERIAKSEHTHFTGWGPYCVVCHIGLVPPDEKFWSDGQERIE